MADEKDKAEKKTVIKETLNKSKEVFEKTKEKVSEQSKVTVEKTKETFGKTKTAVTDKSKKALDKTKTAFDETREAITAKVDVNGDGQFGIEDVIILSFRTPGVYIHRDGFLRRQFFKNYPEEVVKDAIASTPAKAGIPAEEIDKMADEAIKSERNKVSGISAALGLPGGVSMAATIPADIVQYYGFMLRAAQKILYLYGFPDVDADPDEGLQLDDQTMNTIILCLGAMYGVAGANNAIKAVANGLAKGVSNKLMKTALTKGTIYPLIKSISKWFGIKMTKKVLSEAVKTAIPVVGGVIGGGLTFFSFKPCCDRLKDVLKDTMLANPDYKPTDEEIGILNNMIQENPIEAEFAEIVDQAEEKEE